jgi:hypothetical protein
VRPLALLAALVGGALVMPTASAVAAPRVLAGFSAHDFEVRPAAISYTGDGTSYLGGSDGGGPRATDYGHLTWVSWGRRTAYATGVDWLNDCDLDCVRRQTAAYSGRRGASTCGPCGRARRGRGIAGVVAVDSDIHGQLRTPSALVPG